jgi:HEAT repeat protein
MRRPVPTRAALLILAGLCGCAAQASFHAVSAVERGVYSTAIRLYNENDHDPALLRDIAETLLLEEARRRDAPRRRAAFTELGLLGTRAEGLLDRLAEDKEKPEVRARALYLSMRLGDGGAREDLRGLLKDKDPEVGDVAYAALDPARDWERLSEALRAPRAGRRLIALQVIVDPRSSAPPASALSELAEVSRVDPDAAVRAAALHALERFGAAGAPALEQALQDPDEGVRTAALESLARSDPARAEPALDRQLGAATSQESLSAAVALLRMKPARQPARAWDAVNRALGSGDAALRARAATLLRALPDAPRDLDTARAQLAAETTPQVKLALALALGLDEAPARAALAELAQGRSLPAAQAAFELARLGDKLGQTRLLAARYSEQPPVRISAARSLGRELGEPQSVAGLLADRESEVRVAAAGAVLASLLDG